MRIWLTVLCIFLGGCTTLTPAERTELANKIATDHFHQKILTAPNTLPLYGFVKKEAQNAKVLRVYIEGDGYAYVTRRIPSTDPTPTNPIALRLAAADKSPNVLYLARPCQYLNKNDAASFCTQKWWTSDRYSARALQIYHQHLNALKKEWGTESFELIGYSGGGTIAALLAAERHDIDNLITIAANLDTTIFAQHHGLKSMQNNLNPAAVARDVRHIPQRHFVGTEDHIIPQKGILSFLNKAFSSQEEAMRHFEVIPHVAHEKGWVEVWPKLLQEKVAIHRN